MAFNRFDGKEEDFFASVAMSGNLSFVRWCRKFMKWDYRVCTNAASRGDIAMLKYARSRKNPNTGNKVCEMKGPGACACNEAADNGSLGMFEVCVPGENAAALITVKIDTMSLISQLQKRTPSNSSNGLKKRQS